MAWTETLNLLLSGGAGATIITVVRAIFARDKDKAAAAQARGAASASEAEPWIEWGRMAMEDNNNQRIRLGELDSSIARLHRSHTLVVRALEQAANLLDTYGADTAAFRTIIVAAQAEE